MLIMGFSVQCIYWPEGLCDALAARSFQVIRPRRDHDSGETQGVGRAIRETLAKAFAA